MAAEVLTHQQIPTAKPEEASRPDSEAASSTKRNYVPIRPAYRPLLPKPSTRQSTPSPIHIHTRSSGLSQLACRKRHSGVTTKLESAKRRRNLSTRISESANQDLGKQGAESVAAPAVSAQTSGQNSPSSASGPCSPGVGSPAVDSTIGTPSIGSPNLTSVSTRSIFGPPPPQEITDSLAADIGAPFETEAPKSRSVGGSVTSMMSALMSRFQQPQQQAADPSMEPSVEHTSIVDADEENASVFSQLSMERFDGVPLTQLDLDQFNKLDLDLESTVASSAPTLSSSVAASTSISTSDSLSAIAPVPEDSKNLSTQSPETFETFGSPSAEFDEFTDFYFRSNAQSDSVTPTDGSPETLGDVLDNEASLVVDKDIQDDLAMMEFLAPVDLFNA